MCSRTCSISSTRCGSAPLVHKPAAAVGPSDLTGRSREIWKECSCFEIDAIIYIATASFTHISRAVARRHIIIMRT